MRHLVAAAAVLAAGSPVFPQSFDPPPAKTPDAATLKLIAERTPVLKRAVSLAVQKLPDVHRADLEVYVKAVEWIVRHQEWFTADSGKQTLAVIDQGVQRATSAMEGRTPWLDPAGKAVARGYRSRIDDSVQPYGVVYPPGYGADPRKAWRLDVHLHGRDSTLTEVKHLNQHNGRPAPKDQDFVQLNIFGRGNNAYRWAGETDVFEAMDHFLAAEAAAGRKGLINPRRVVLKGFSMGGAGTWHIGLRHPDRFAALQPGAGFTTTHGYIAKLPDPLPDYQERCLTIYDAYRYAENACNVPIVAYSGEIDKQRQAAENIQAELKRVGLSDRMTHLIGPGLEHKFPPEWQKAAEAELRKFTGDGKGRHAYPDRVRFTTWSLMQPRCDWVTIDEMVQHYTAATVDAGWDGQTFRVATKNVRQLSLTPPADHQFPVTLVLDGQEVQARGETGRGIGQSFRHEADQWKPVEPAGQRDAAVVRKGPHLTGPIDVAFTDRFICVVGTGTPMHPAMHRAALGQLDRFRREWDKWMRGELVIRKDTELTDDERRSRALILFGDPGSNKLIAEVLPKLPLRWTPSVLEFGGQMYDPSTHLPMMVQGARLSPGSYLVLNSGHTFHEADFKGTNALLYPRLGDYAIARPTPSAQDPAAFEVVTAGLFDEGWRVPPK